MFIRRPDYSDPKYKMLFSSMANPGQIPMSKDYMASTKGLSSAAGGLGWQNLPFLTGKMSEEQALGRYQEEQGAADLWNVSRWKQGMDYWKQLFDDPALKQYGQSVTENLKDPGIPPWLKEAMFSRTADEIDRETTRTQDEVQAAASARGLGASGLGLGAMAGVANQRTAQMSGARRDIEIWAAQQREQQRAQASTDAANYLGLVLGMTQGRYNAETDIERKPNDYAAWMNTQQNAISMKSGSYQAPGGLKMTTSRGPAVEQKPYQGLKKSDGTYVKGRAANPTYNKKSTTPPKDDFQKKQPYGSY